MTVAARESVLAARLKKYVPAEVSHFTVLGSAPN